MGLLIRTLAFALAICGASASCTSAQVHANGMIPSEFQGEWSESPAACEHSEQASYFVTNRTVGGFEHMYPISELVREGRTIRFLSMGGGQTKLELLENGRMRVSFNQEPSVLLVRCPADASD